MDGSTGGPTGADLLLGADIGGTSTRIAVARIDGTLLGIGRGAAGNPNAVGFRTATDEISATLGRCLADAGLRTTDAARVGSAVVGMAGASALDDPDGFLAGALPGVRVDRVRLVSDFAVAFASGTPRPDGYVLLAGTGAGAASVAAGEVTERRDGWGWLLGDTGSGFWLGREAVRATLDELQRGLDPGPLATRVLASTATHDHATLLRRVYGQPPIALAGLARLVGETAATDPAAAAVVGRAATALVDTLASLDPLPGQPVVITGSVLTSPGPVRDAVRAELGRRFALDPSEAVGGLAGALWSALVAAGRPAPDPTSTPAVHARLVAQDFGSGSG